MSAWTHDGLALDLARSREGNGEAVACPLSLGSFGTQGAADVAALRLSRSRPQSTIWEVKRTRSDFLADVNAGKYTRYLPFCHRFYFATPAGLISKSEVPEGCGWVVRGEKGWSGVVAGRRRTVEPDAWQEILLAHLMSCHPGPWQKPTRVQRLRAEVARESGKLRDLLLSRDDRLKELGEAAVAAISEGQSLRRELELVLGEDFDNNTTLACQVARAIQKVRREGEASTPRDIRAALNTLGVIERQARSARERLEAESP